MRQANNQNRVKVPAIVLQLDASVKFSNFPVRHLLGELQSASHFVVWTARLLG